MVLSYPNAILLDTSGIIQTFISEIGPEVYVNDVEEFVRQIIDNLLSLNGNNPFVLDFSRFRNEDYETIDTYESLLLPAVNKLFFSLEQYLKLQDPKMLIIQGYYFNKLINNNILLLKFPY